MEVQKAKGGIYPVAFFVMLMLINAHCSGAAVLVKSNASVRCDDHPEQMPYQGRSGVRVPDEPLHKPNAC